MTLKPICVPCQRFFRPARTGVSFVEGMPDGGRPAARPGLAEPSRWQPYKVWLGDLWACQDCGATIIVGVGAGPVAEHYQPGFREAAQESVLQVNDC